MVREDKGDGKTNPVQNCMKTKETGLGVGQWSGDKGRKLLQEVLWPASVALWRKDILFSMG